MKYLRNTGRRNLTTMLAGLVVVITLIIVPTAYAALTFYAAQNDSGSIANYTVNKPKESAAATWITAADKGIWLFGDSITVSDSYDLAVILNQHSLTTAVFAQGGAPTKALVDYAIQRKATSAVVPKVIVMAAGTNDIFNPEVMPAQINRMYAAFPNSKIIWVTTWAQRWSQLSAVQIADSRNSGRVNGAILALCTHVVDWGRYVASSSGRSTAYFTDGVHTSASGRLARNTLIANKVKQLYNIP